MFEDEQQQPEAPRRPSALRRAAVATALVAGVMAGGYGIAAAQTDETPSTTAPDDSTQQQAPDATRPDGQGCDRGQDGTTGSTDPGSSSSSSGSSADASSL